MLDLVLPLDCGGCGAPSTRWCAACAGQLAVKPDQPHLITPRVDPGVPVLSLGRYAGTRREAIVEAEDEAARMGRLVGDLLLLARADAGELPVFSRVPVDLAELAHEVVEQARPARRPRRLTATSDGSCVVLGDRDRLKQLLANLVENALRYTPRGGRVRIAATMRSRDVEVRVADTGADLSEEELPRIFDRFYKGAGSTGSGLGLTIVRNLIEAHGGTVRAESRPGAGTTIVFSLPR